MKNNIPPKKQNKFMKSNMVTLLLGIYFLLTPIDFGLANVMPGGAPLKYLSLVIIILILGNGYGNEVKLHVNKSHYALLLWVLVILISLILRDFYPDTFPYSLNYIRYSLFLIVVTAFRYSEKQINLFLKSTMMGSTIASMFLLADLTFFPGSSSRYSLKLFGSINDPNSVAVDISFGIIIALFFLFKRKENKILYLFIIGINTISIFLTGSRTALLTIVVSVTVFLYYFIKNNKNNKRRLINLLMMLIVVYLVSQSIGVFIPENLINRLLELDSYSSGSDRTIIWKHMINLILEKPIFGYGIGSTVSLMYNFSGMRNVGHNIYLNMLLELGILGLLLIIIVIFSIYLDAIKKKRYLSISILVIGTVSSFFLEGLVKGFFWNSLILSILITNYVNTTENLESLDK